MTGIHFRPANTADAGALGQLLQQLAADRHTESDTLGDHRSGVNYLQRCAQYPDYRIILAEDQSGRPIATASLLIIDNWAHQGAPYAIIENVVVDHACRGHSVGRQLMQYVLDQAQQAGCYKAMLSANLRRERAHTFYQRLGFQLHGYSFALELIDAA